MKPKSSVDFLLNMSHLSLLKETHVGEQFKRDIDKKKTATMRLERNPVLATFPRIHKDDSSMTLSNSGEDLGTSPPCNQIGKYHNYQHRAFIH